MRLTLTERLLFSMGTVLMAFLVAGLVSLHSATIVRERLNEMVETAGPPSEAAYAMEINPAETGLAVKGYLNGRDAQALALLAAKADVLAAADQAASFFLAALVFALVFGLAAAGAIANYVFVFSDIGGLKAAERRLEHLAHHDPLTKLPNRLLFYDRLDHALARARRGQRRIGLIFLGLDRFKIINDTLGHSVGDRLLQAVSARLQGCLRADDTVSRIGGDEFTVIVEDLDSAGYAGLVAEKILAALVPPIVLDERNINVTASIGIGLFPDDAVDSEALVKSADMAMRLAKGHGGSGSRFYTRALTERIQRDLVVEDGLRAALAGEGLELHYQPLVETMTRNITGAEALLRWHHHELGWVPPQEVLRVAEECGLVHRLAEWVLATACAQAKAWDDADLPFHRLAVNVSPRQLLDDGFVARVDRLLREAGLDPALLEIEITEHSLQTGPQAADRLHQLKALGVWLALDDFGTGYSCLASLKVLPFDRVKIDRSFVTGLIDDPNDRAITTAIIAMSKSLGLEVVAEGVEAEPIMQALLEYGCHAAQGYLFGRPAPAAIFEQRLRDARAAPRIMERSAA